MKNWYQSFVVVGKVTLVCRKKLFHTLFIIANSKCSNILAHDKLLYVYLVDIHIQLVVSQALRRAVNVAVVKLTNHRLNRTHQYIVLMDWILSSAINLSFISDETCH